MAGRKKLKPPQPVGEVYENWVGELLDIGDAMAATLVKLAHATEPLTSEDRKRMDELRHAWGAKRRE